jgi:hypothetical protein
MYCCCIGPGSTQKLWQNEIQMFNTVGERERGREWVKEIYIRLAVLNEGFVECHCMVFGGNLINSLCVGFSPQPKWWLPSVPCCFSQTVSWGKSSDYMNWAPCWHHVKPINTIYCCLLCVKTLESICFVRDGFVFCKWLTASHRNTLVLLFTVSQRGGAHRLVE